MKLTIEIDVTVDVETETETGRVDGVWVNGVNYADGTVEELIIAIADGPRGWSKKISEAIDNLKRTFDDRDRSEDEYGVPV